FGQLWVVLPVVVAAGVALSGIGAALGLVLPRADLATVAGQLAMTAVLFLGVIPPTHLPAATRPIRDALPALPAVDVLAAARRGLVGDRLAAGGHGGVGRRRPGDRRARVPPGGAAVSTATIRR